MDDRSDPAVVVRLLTTPFGTDRQVAAKPGAPGPVTCSINAGPAGFRAATLTGTVTGTITWRGVSRAG